MCIFLILLFLINTCTYISCIHVSDDVSYNYVIKLFTAMSNNMCWIFRIKLFKQVKRTSQNKWNRTQGAQYPHWLVSLLTWCCITIRDASPTLKQHWFNVLCLNRIATVILIVSFKRFHLSIPNTQYWLDTDPLSATLARNWNIG